MKHNQRPALRSVTCSLRVRGDDWHDVDVRTGRFDGPGAHLKEARRSRFCLAVRMVGDDSMVFSGRREAFDFLWSCDLPALAFKIT